MSTSMNNSIIVNGGREPMIKHAYVYHMTWDALQMEQPDKVPVLERWFDAIGERPSKNGTLVFDITEQIVYVSAGLGYKSNTCHYQNTRSMVIKCLNNGTKFHAYKKNWDDEMSPYEGHRFIAVEDTPIIMLEDALDNYKKQERKSYAKAKAYDALEKALAEAKELLK